MTHLADNSEANCEFERRLASAAIALGKDERALGSVERDFGRIAGGRPLGVIHACDERELQAVFELANACRVRLTLRAGGNSQSGQSLAHGSYNVSLSRLEKSLQVEPLRAAAVCSASCTWRELVQASAGHGLVPN